MTFDQWDKLTQQCANIKKEAGENSVRTNNLLKRTEVEANNGDIKSQYMMGLIQENNQWFDKAISNTDDVSIVEKFS